MKIIFLIICSLSYLLTQGAEKIRIGDLYYFLDKSNNTAEITFQFENDYKNYSHLSQDFSIPTAVKYQGVTYDVTTIGERAFYCCNAIKSVTIPPSIKEMKHWCFNGGSYLRKINITDLNAWLGIKFQDSSSNPTHEKLPLYLNGEELTEIIIPDHFESIPDYCFIGVKNLKSIYIPKSIKHIGKDAFSYCGLKEVNIEDLEAWCRLSFENKDSNPLACGRLYINGEEVHEIEIPETITEILPNAFTNLKGVEKVIIPNSVKKIGERAFYFSEVKEFEIPESVTHIGKSVFCWCMEIESLTIPDSVVEIGDNAVAWCNNLKVLTFPKHLMDRWGEAFNTNVNLEKLHCGKKSYDVTHHTTK